MRFQLKQISFAGMLACLGASALALAPDYHFVQPKSMEMSKVAPFTVALAAKSLPGAVVGFAYNIAGYNLAPLATVTGDQSLNQSLVTFALTSGSLPDGLALSASGLISGTPTAVSSNSVQVTASYKAVTAAQNYNLTSTLPGPVGQIAYTTPGAFTFTTPEGVTSISIVAVGGGGGGTVNKAGTVYAGSAGGLSRVGAYVNAGGGAGMATSGGVVNAGIGFAGGASGYGYGGGGAGGYAGLGGAGGSQNGLSGGGGGGGTGLLGLGANGVGGSRFNGISGNGASGAGGAGGGGGYAGGGGGSGGGVGAAAGSNHGGAGGFPGGGGGTAVWVYFSVGGGGGALAYANSITVTPGQTIPVIVGAGGAVGDGLAGVGAGGAVRIIWGAGRAFPSAQTADQ